MSRLTEYIIALTNLYGFVYEDKVVEVYNSQNEDHVTFEEIDDILMHSSKELDDAFVYHNGNYFVHQGVAGEDFESIRARQKHKPYYVPDKEELLKYVDESYFEKTTHYQALFEYIKRNLCKGDEKKTEALCACIHGTCQAGADLQIVMDLFDDQNIHFKNADRVKKVENLISELSNNIRR